MKRKNMPNNVNNRRIGALERLEALPASDNAETNAKRQAEIKTLKSRIVGSNEALGIRH